MPFIDYQPPLEACRSRQHNPPGLILLPAGKHTYQCPDCLEVTEFYVREVYCNA